MSSLEYRLQAGRTSKVHRIPPKGGTPNLRRLSACVIVALLSGCAGGDMRNQQYRAGPGQAVQSPYAYAAANDEVFSRQSGAMPFLTVDFSNNKDEPARVTTIADSLEILGIAAQRDIRPRATTRPAGSATAPAVEAGAGAGTQPVTVLEVRSEMPVRVVGQQRTEDRIAVAAGAEGEMVVRIISGMGIGTVTLERTGERWPAAIVVELTHADGKKFTRLEGFTASEVTADGRKVALRSIVEREQGRATIGVPAFSRGERILVEWVDAYR